MTAISIRLALMIILGATDPSPVADAPNPGFATASAPPPRPLPLTAQQVGALQSLSQQPEHAVPPDTRAAFSPAAQRTLTEWSAGGFYVGYAGTIIAVLVAAAPL